MKIIHCLVGGSSCCRMPGFPGEWPEEHHWLGKSDWPSSSDEKECLLQGSDSLCEECERAVRDEYDRVASIIERNNKFSSGVEEIKKGVGSALSYYNELCNEHLFADWIWKYCPEICGNRSKFDKDRLNKILGMLSSKEIDRLHNKLKLYANEELSVRIINTLNLVQIKGEIIEDKYLYNAGCDLKADLEKLLDSVFEIIANSIEQLEEHKKLINKVLDNEFERQLDKSEESTVSVKVGFTC